MMLIDSQLFDLDKNFLFLTARQKQEPILLFNYSRCLRNEGFSLHAKAATALAEKLISGGP